MSVNHFSKFLKQRKGRLMLALLAVSGLYAAMHFLEARGTKKEEKATPANHFNMKLPDPIFDEKEEKMTKLDYYRRADEDSLRKRQAMQQDPYFGSTSPSQSLAGKSTGRANVGGLIMDGGPAPDFRTSQDPRADELLKQLDQFKKAMQKPAASAVDPSREGV